MLNNVKSSQSVYNGKHNITMSVHYMLVHHNTHLYYETGYTKRQAGEYEK